MVSMIAVLFVSIVVPLLFSLFLLEKNARQIVGFMVIGLCCCLLVSKINAYLLRFISQDIYYFTTTITPIIEEIGKAIPVLWFAFAVSDNRQKLLSLALAVGIGFAILENTYYVVLNLDSVSIYWALVRGFGSGLVHGICTAAVGYGLSYIRQRRKLCYTGTFALLTSAIIYHALYNVLVQSAYNYVGFVLPVLTYIPVVIWLYNKKEKMETLAG